MTVISVSAISKQISPYQGKRQTLVQYQDVNDIIGALVKYTSVDAADYDRISDRFWKGDVKSTAEFLFTWCKDHIRYRIEPDTRQTVKSPAAILAQKKGDCKHYASFINGVVKSLKRKGHPIDSVYRFASYKTFSKSPHHVFAVVTDTNTGAEYWVDPVLSRFNRRKPYTSNIDKNAPTMLQRVSGIYDLPSISGRRNKPAKKAKKQQRKAKRRERRKNRPRGGLFKKIGGAPMRNAFLLMLKMNLFKRASKLFVKMKSSPAAKQKVEAWWKKLGGNPAKLNQAITQGVKVYNKHHKSKQLKGIGWVENQYGWDASVTGIYVDGIGILPVAGAAAILATAAPIIAKLKTLFKSLGIKDEQGAPGAQDVAPGEGGGGDGGGGELPPMNSSEESDSGGDSEEPEDPTEPTDDFGIEDPEEYEEYTGEEMGAFWQSKAKRQAGKQKRVQKRAAKKQPKTIAPKMPAAAKAIPPAAPGRAAATPTARKVKTRTVNFNLGPGTGGKKIPTKITPKKPGTPRTDEDSGGIKQFFSDAKEWVGEHKVEVGLGIASLFAAPMIARLLSSKPKRRR